MRIPERFVAGVHFAKDLTLSFIFDPVTWVGEPELAADVARTIGLSEQWTAEFVASAHLAKGERNIAEGLLLEAGLMRPISHEYPPSIPG